ncbi:MAG TPA: PIG-L family deacetylase, partial [Candidatus Limnocylindrales bacterium]|nr:PIG-L family deacetylase [Candidatus Limnocylindrales bacterium]
GQLKIATLAGDYWYVTPVKAASERPLTIVPVVNCSEPREVLNSQAWLQPERLNRPAAYLAIRDPGTEPTYGGCGLPKITGHYGIPSNITPLESDPNALLLIYGQGLESPMGDLTGRSRSAEQQYQTLQPINNGTSCAKGVTLNIVAHQDDDLLFLSPDLLRDVDARRCIRTLFVTAGDAGQDLNYWYGREQGAMAAYAQMYNVPNSWRQAHQTIAGRRVSVQYLNGVPQVSLVFLRLPDGGIPGEGFATDKHQSLKHLYEGAVQTLASVDGKATYTEQGLISALVDVMAADKPDIIRTQDDSAANRADDHSDHRLVGYFTKLAHSRYHQRHNLKTYLGYTQRLKEPNVSEEDVARKQAAFFTYGAFDPSVCRSVEECALSETYGLYLQRQYIVDDIHRKR